MAFACGFIVLVGVGVFTSRLPRAILALYLGASVVAFLAYAFDKSAARRAGRRTRESTLHLLGLVGGWPGALLAQQLLRHKSIKPQFQRVYWATVILNCGALGWLLTDTGSAFLSRIEWKGSSYADLCAFPQEARDDAGYQLERVQAGEDPGDWKPMSLIGPGVREICIHEDSGEFRVAYLATRREAVYVLHAFQKKSQKTSRTDLALAIKRFKTIPTSGGAG